MLYCILQDIESAIKEQFDVVLDTIGIPETERIGINLLKKGGHYMTLQVAEQVLYSSISSILKYFSCYLGFDMISLNI